ncbi:predicted protein [Sclerotinia sclerotiorum 1980 UF-70]|uniref:Uncharacterized protein n=1 Tax=Sclerotinia sclerotiorum (strain ATCC 18683 / 1980 / Ss-1) TaxID=665079 RepID=A7EPT3_SCLS1|nr:predicted protein [Sclerotinia sclerotiorum 1980 UF-70]EDO04849.1 predicted protein [Sclerotinia sclerotiorum 1980 UF-70]
MVSSSVWTCKAGLGQLATLIWDGSMLGFNESVEVGLTLSDMRFTVIS